MSTTIETERISGNMLDVTCLGGLTKWKEFEISFMEKTEDATAADSEEDEEWSTTRWIEGRVTGFLGTANNGATLPMPRDPITDLSAKVGGVEVLPDLSDYTNIKVKAPVKYSFVQGLASFEFSFRSGRLN